MRWSIADAAKLGAMSTGHLPLASLREGGGFSGWCVEVNVPPFEAGLAQTNAQLRETGVLTVATVLTRGRDIHHIKIAIDPHVVAPFEARPVGLLPDESGSQPGELASPVLIWYQCRFTRPPRRMGSRSSRFFVLVCDHLTAPVTPVRICAHYQFNGCQPVRLAYGLICGISCVKEQ